MDSHGGRVEIDSEKGRGTTVCVPFPPSRVIAPPSIPLVSS